MSKLSLSFSTVIFALITFLLLNLSAISQNIGINDSGNPPSGSAGLDVNFSDKGLLVPRLTTTERDAIQNPIMSLLIFNTQTECFEAWNSNSSNWVSFGCIGCDLPTVSTASAGTNINATDFDANWSASSGVIYYYLDVATDNNFTSFVPGFSGLNIGNVITYNVTGLTCETDYYFRVRAENICGFSEYSNTISVSTGACCGNGYPLTDSRDTKTYQTVQIGSQCWMKENLNYTPGSGNSWCYDNDPNNCTIYGRLYDWSTAMAGSSGSSLNPSNVQGICPVGWHLPSDAEWCQLENEVEANTDVGCNSTGQRGTATGKNLKASSPLWDGDNASGFTALPGGYYAGGGSFNNVGYFGRFWSTTEDSGTGGAWYRYLRSHNGIYRYPMNKTFGYSIRCIKD